MAIFTTFAQVQAALDNFVTTNNIPISSAPHGAMWKRGTTPAEQYNNFVTGDAISGFPILVKGSGGTSNIILALLGLPPFDGSQFPQMPPGGPVLDPQIVGQICGWIDNGAQQ